MCVWCCWGTETLCLKSNGAVPHQLPQCRSIYAKLSWQSLLSINTTLLVQRFISFWTITIDGPSLHRLYSVDVLMSSVHILRGDNGLFIFFFAVFMVRHCYVLDLKCCGMMEMTTFWALNSVPKRRDGLFISSHGWREQMTVVWMQVILCVTRSKNHLRNIQTVIAVFLCVHDLKYKVIIFPIASRLVFLLQTVASHTRYYGHLSRNRNI